MFSFFYYNLYSQCCKTDPAEIRGTWQAVEAVIFVLSSHYFSPKPADLHLRLRRESRATRCFLWFTAGVGNSWLSFRLLPAARNTKSPSAPRVLKPAWWMLNIIITRLQGRRRSGLVSVVSQVDSNWSDRCLLLLDGATILGALACQRERRRVNKWSKQGSISEERLRRRFQFRYTQCIKRTMRLFTWQSQK